MNKIKSSIGFLYLACTLLITFLVYSLSLSRTWQPFDEGFIFNEEFLPIPGSFSEIFEIINNFVFNCHLLSMNSFFSNIVNLRTNPVAWSFLTFILYFFKKSTLLWHIFQLSIHLINVSLLWFIFKAGFKPALTKSALTMVSIFALLWALHPINTEAVLLVTNWNANLTYTFFFAFLLYEISNINNPNKIINYLLIPGVFLIPLTLTEYSFIFPVVLFFVLIFLRLSENTTLKDTILHSFKKTIPYLIGLFVFIGLVLLLKNYSAVKNSINHESYFLERNFWLAPQLFVHNLKIFLFPKTLSTFQSNLVHLSNSFFEPYSIFCTFFYFSFLILPLLFLTKKSGFRKFVPLFYAVYFAFSPFLHILTPTYCLSAERYWYFPSFLFLYLVIHLIKTSSKKTTIFLILILIILTGRTLFRIHDWQNPFYFYKSVVVADKNSLYKGQKFLIFADFLDKIKMGRDRDVAINLSINELTKALDKLKLLKEKHHNQPKVLKLYGLDYKSLSIKAAYALSIIKKHYLKESDENIISFLSPYIRNDMDQSPIDAIAFLGNLLIKSGKISEGISILEYGYKKIPYYLDLNLGLSDAYLQISQEKKALNILEKSYAIFPNKGFVLYKLMKYYEMKKDAKNQEKFTSLLRLRGHLKEIGLTQSSQGMTPSLLYPRTDGPYARQVPYHCSHFCVSPGKLSNEI